MDKTLLKKTSLDKISNESKNQEIIAVYSDYGVMLDYDMSSNNNYSVDNNMNKNKTSKNKASQQGFYQNDKLVEDFKNDQFKAWFYFGFEENIADMTPSLAFVHFLALRFIQALSRNPDIEFTRKAEDPGDEELLEIMERVPYAIGIEFINIDKDRKFERTKMGASHPGRSASY